MIALYGWLGLRIIRVASMREDVFGKIYCFGVFAWIIGQSFINIGAMIGLLPLTGITLPFLSYGGTALISSMAAMGVIVNLSKNKA